MSVLNNGILDGIRRIGAKVRDLTIDGGLPGAPLGYRLRGATQSGPPQTGTWKAGDQVPDRNGVIWICTAGGTGLAAMWVSETSRAETAEALLAPKASPALTGTPTAPTAAQTVSGTQLATTSFVSTAVAAGGVFSPFSYGAVGGGSVDDTTALQNCAAAAVAACGIIDLGDSVFRTSAPINITSNFHMRGAGFNTGAYNSGGCIVNSASAIFTIASSASQVIFENCSFSSGAGGGHIWDASNGPSMSFWRISGVWAQQLNSGKGVWYQNGGLFIDSKVSNWCNFSCAAGATVSPWTMINIPGAVNGVKFSEVKCLANGAAVPFFRIDPGYSAHTDTNVGMTAGSTAVADTLAASTDLTGTSVGFYVYSPNFPGGSSRILSVTPGTGYTVATPATATLSGQTCLIGAEGFCGDIVFDFIDWEVCTGGAIAATGCMDVSVNWCAFWDTTATANIYSFSKSNTGYACRNIQVRGGRCGGVTGGAYNLYCDSSTTNVLVDSFGQWATPPLISSPAAQTTIINPTISSGIPVPTFPGFPALSLIPGLASAIPAASSAYLNQWYLATDTSVLSFCNGTAWTVIPAATPTAPNVQYFTSSGTWTKPAGAQTVMVAMGASTGGAGSGATGPAGTVRCGGGGAAGGSIISREFAASDLTATVAVTVDQGGAGGVAVQSASAAVAGNPGTNGGTTSFGSYQSVLAGARGLGGSTSSGAGGAAGVAGEPGGAGASSSGTGGAGVGANAAYGGAGAPAGGGITSANVAGAGAAGTNSYSGNSTYFGAAGAVDAATPTSGTAPTVKGSASGSPGSGAASITTNAQAGANGNISAGGAGGGASVNPNNSGPGGNGGPGWILAITYFQLQSVTVVMRSAVAPRFAPDEHAYPARGDAEPARDRPLRFPAGHPPPDLGYVCGGQPGHAVLLTLVAGAVALPVGAHVPLVCAPVQVLGPAVVLPAAFAVARLHAIRAWPGERHQYQTMDFPGATLAVAAQHDLKVAVTVGGRLHYPARTMAIGPPPVGYVVDALVPDNRQPSLGWGGRLVHKPDSLPVRPRITVLAHRRGCSYIRSILPCHAARTVLIGQVF